MYFAWRFVAFTGLLCTGCSGILGLDEFGAAAGEGGGPSTTATSSESSASTTTSGAAEGGSGGAGSGGGGGALGSGGAGGATGEACDEEGVTEPCYESDLSTIGVGECVAGERTCSDGTWTVCEGQVVPREEDLATWADESCSPGDLEVRTFVRYAGTNDDYIGGAGWLDEPIESPDAVVAIGTYGDLTIGGETISTEIDFGTALVRHRRDGEAVWVRGLTTSAPSGLATGMLGSSLLRGYAAVPEIVDGITLDGDFLALVDGDGTFRDVLEVLPDERLGGTIYGHLGAYGIVDNTIRRYRVRYDEMTVTATTDIDFGSQQPSGVVRSSNQGHLIVTGKIAGNMALGGCVAQTTADDSFIAVFSGTTQPVCVALTTLGVTGSSTITAVQVAGDRLYVSGRFSGTLTDETGASLISEGSGSAFVARMILQANGQLSLVWLRAFGGSGLVSGGALLPDPTGGVVWNIHVPNDGAADVGGVEVGAHQALVSLDASGTVRYVRHLGPKARGGFRMTADLLLAVGDLSDDSLPFGIDPLPPPGGMSDAYFAVLEAP